MKTSKSEKVYNFLFGVLAAPFVITVAAAAFLSVFCVAMIERLKWRKESDYHQED